MSNGSDSQEHMCTQMLSPASISIGCSSPQIALLYGWMIPITHIHLPCIGILKDKREVRLCLPRHQESNVLCMKNTKPWSDLSTAASRCKELIEAS